jgi:hypothetical protein
MQMRPWRRLAVAEDGRVEWPWAVGDLAFLFCSLGRAALSLRCRRNPQDGSIVAAACGTSRLVSVTDRGGDAADMMMVPQRVYDSRRPVRTPAVGGVRRYRRAGRRHKKGADPKAGPDLSFGGKAYRAGAAPAPEPGPKVISTRRFCGSRTPSAVSTSGLLLPNASVDIAPSGTPLPAR